MKYFNRMFEIILNSQNIFIYVSRNIATCLTIKKIILSVYNIIKENERLT